jgi:IS66 Orf2 like protein
MRAEESKHRGQLIKPGDADLWRAERHAGAIALVEHPVRQLAAQIRPLLRVDARQRLAAPERRDLQRSPEQRMPTIGYGRESKTVCRMSVALLVWDGSGLVLLWKRLESGAFRWPPVTDGVMRLSAAQLAVLLDGLDWTRMHVPRLGRPKTAQ